jgi:uncharacterized membrane protein YdjX (TVP38/TMEM64 family)
VFYKESNRNILHKWLIVLAILGGLAAIIYFLFYTRTGVKLTNSNMYLFVDNLKSLGNTGKLIGVLLLFIQSCFPVIPFVVVAGANVAIFGMKLGFIVNYLVSCAGATLVFIFVRATGHRILEQKMKRMPTIIEFSKRMEKHGFIFVFLARMIPIIPSSVISISAGLTRMKLRHYLWGTWLGNIPIIYLESLIAHDLFHFHAYKNRLLLLLLLFVSLLLIGSWLKKRLAINKVNK